jgi:hypothetical protein
MGKLYDRKETLLASAKVLGRIEHWTQSGAEVKANSRTFSTKNVQHIPQIE